MKWALAGLAGVAAGLVAAWVFRPRNEVSGTVDGPNAEVFTVDLRDLGDSRTEMTFTQTGGNLPADEYSRAMRGMLIFLERQAAHLAAIQAV